MEAQILHDNEEKLLHPKGGQTRKKGADGQINQSISVYSPHATNKTQLPQTQEQHDKIKKREQIKVYAITYLTYALIHFQREFWSLSKTELKDKHPNELPTEVLSRFDTAQLLFYAICLYICGVIGDSYDQRKVLTIALGNLTVFFFLLSLAGFFDMTSQPYFYFVQIFIGVFNAFLLPCMIAIMGNWFPKKNRGFIVGLWATCNNFGNIVGIQLAAFLMEDVFNNQWQWLMVLASILALVMCLIIFFFLVPHPEQIGITVEEMTEKEILIATATQKDVFDNVIRQSISANAGRMTIDPEEVVRQVRLSGQYRRLSVRESIKDEPEQKITFLQAWMLPRVILYSSAFFCTKMAVYCLLLLLPSFLKNPDMHYTLQGIANLSTVIDIGAMFGSMALGYISDLMHGKRSPVALAAVLISIAVSYTITFTVTELPTAVFFILMFILGFCISGLNNMISSACSADLGKQDALKGNSRAVSTVTGIIDGTGTLGSAAGQFIVAITQKEWGWYNGYLLIIAIDITITIIPIMIIVYQEFNELKKINASKVAMGIVTPRPQTSRILQQ